MYLDLTITLLLGKSKLMWKLETGKRSGNWKKELESGKHRKFGNCYWKWKQEVGIGNKKWKSVFGFRNNTLQARECHTPCGPLHMSNENYCTVGIFKWQSRVKIWHVWYPGIARLQMSWQPFTTLPIILNNVNDNNNFME